MVRFFKKLTMHTTLYKNDKVKGWEVRAKKGNVSKISHSKNLSIVQGRQVIVFELEAESG
jgi:hypothetical protein